MIDKKIIGRIVELEKQYPVADFDVEEYTKQIIAMLENALERKLTINLPQKKYLDKETLAIDIYKLLPIEDLRALVYGKNKTINKN